MEQETSELAMIKTKMSRILELVAALQEHIDDITLSADDKVAIEGYHLAKAKGTLATLDDVERMRSL